MDSSSVPPETHSNKTGIYSEPPDETGTYNEPAETDTYNEPNEMNAYDESDETDTHNEPDGTGTYNEPDGTGTYNEPDGTGTYNEPNGTGTYNEPDGTGTYNEPDGTGTYNEPDEDTYNEPDGTGLYNEPSTHCDSPSEPVTYEEIDIHSTNAYETPPQLPPYDNGRTAMPLTRTTSLRISWLMYAYQSLTVRDKVGVMVVGCAVILILVVSVIQAAVAARPLSKISKSQGQATNQLNFTSLADDQHWVYVDGVVVNHMSDCGTVIMSSIPTSTLVLGVKVINTRGRGGLLGSLSDGHMTYAVTDDTWKCTRNQYDKWAEPDFDDSTWPRAEPVSQDESNEGQTWGRWQQIAPNAQWIWNGPRETQHADIFQFLISPTVTVYCRTTLNLT